MAELERKAAELAAALKSTREYAELKQAKAYVDSKPELKSKLGDLSRLQMSLYSGRLSSHEAEAKVAELNRKYSSMSGVPGIDRYLKAAGKINEMMAGLMRIMNESIEAGLK